MDNKRIWWQGQATATAGSIAADVADASVMNTYGGVVAVSLFRPWLLARLWLVRKPKYKIQRVSWRQIKYRAKYRAKKLDGAFVFESRADLTKRQKIIRKVFADFGLEMHTGSNGEAKQSKAKLNVCLPNKRNTISIAPSQPRPLPTRWQAVRNSVVFVLPMCLQR